MSPFFSSFYSLVFIIKSNLQHSRFCSSSQISMDSKSKNKPQEWLGDNELLTPDQKALARFSLKGKKAVVTGAAHGMPLDAAYSLLEHGASHLYLLDRNEQLLSTAASHLSRLFPGSVIEQRIVDIGDTTALEQVAVEGELIGGFDIVLAFAGIVVPKSIKDHTDADWQAVLDINYNGTFNTVRSFGSRMIAAGRRGSIILMGSCAAYRSPLPNSNIAYSSSKAACLSMTKSFASEWAPYGIRVNSISPGYMYSALSPELPEPLPVWYQNTPMQRIGSRGEITGPVVLLASNAGSFITGSDIIVDGGKSALS